MVAISGIDKQIKNLNTNDKNATIFYLELKHKLNNGDKIKLQYSNNCTINY